MIQNGSTRRCENLVIGRGVNPGRSIRTHRATTSSRPAQPGVHQQAGYTIAHLFIWSVHFVLQTGRRPYTPIAERIERPIPNTETFELKEERAILKTVKTPQTEKDILDFLKNSFDIDWSTYAQVRFRLIWLDGLGKIEKQANGYLAKA